MRAPKLVPSLCLAVVASAACAGDGGVSPAPQPASGLCAPGSIEACYTGPDATRGVGACAAGVRTCDAAGAAWGPCEGEITPAAEDCATTADEDCDGGSLDGDAACACVPGEVVACYSGASGTEGVGACRAGTAVCDSSGTGLGACEGEIVPVEEDCAAPGDEDCDGVACSAPVCAVLAGDGAEQLAAAVALDAAGNSYAAGRFGGSVDWGAGPLVSAGGNDVYVVAHTPGCGLLYAVRFGDGSEQSVFDLAVSPDGEAVIVGWSAAGTLDLGAPCAAIEAPGLFAARLDAEGHCLWVRPLGSSLTVGATAAMASDGAVVVAGDFEGDIGSGELALSAVGSADAFVAALDGATGAMVWAKRFGDSAAQRIAAVATSPLGDVVAVGSFEGAVDLGGGPLDAGAAQQAFVVRLDGAGEHLWSRAFGSADGAVSATAVDVDPDDEVVVAGEADGGVDFGSGILPGAGLGDVFVVRLGTAGKTLSARRFGDADSQIATGVSAAAGGGVVVSGGYYGEIDFGGGPLPQAGGFDAFLARLDGDGNHVWSKRFGDGLLQVAFGAAVDATSGEVVVVGMAEGTVGFGTGPLTSAGSKDAFLARFSP